MNFEVAVAEVQQILGWRSDKSTEIQNALKYAQTQREMPGRTYPWFLQQTLTFATVADQQEYNIPSGYIQDAEEDEGNLFIYTGTGTSTNRTVFLKKMDFQIAQQKYFGAWPTSDLAEFNDESDEVEPAMPQSYVLEATTLRLYPTPDAIYTVNWRCWAAATVMTTGQENAWLRNAPWVMIGEAAVKLAADLNNAAALATAQGVLGRADQDLFRAVIHRKEVSRKRSMGSRL